jgi:hypothetical protein
MEHMKISRLFTCQHVDSPDSDVTPDVRGLTLLGNRGRRLQAKATFCPTALQEGPGKGFVDGERELAGILHVQADSQSDPTQSGRCCRTKFGQSSEFGRPNCPSQWQKSSAI